MNIALIGLRCAGKSTLGRQLASALDRPFVDLDERVLAEFPHQSVAQAWRTHGEATWRAIEARELVDALEEEGAVLALGGGVPMIPSARQLLIAQRQADALRIVYLQCSEAELLRRRRDLKEDDRPRLADETLEGEITRTQRERHTTYEELADFTLDVSALTADESVERIAAWVRSIGE